MNVREASAKIFDTLSPRTAMQAPSAVGKTCAPDRWTAYVFTHSGVRVLSCLHDHATSIAAMNCAVRLVRRWASFEAQRGVRP